MPRHDHDRGYLIISKLRISKKKHFFSKLQDDERRSERSHRPVMESEPYAEEEEDGDYSDADDFIVDADGRPLAEKKRKRKPIFSDAALQEAQDIFGVDFDYDEFSKYDQDDYDEEEDDEEDEYEEDEEGERR